jgi:hypothetical protein
VQGNPNPGNLTLIYLFIAARVTGFILGDACTAFFLAKVDSSPLKLIARSEREKGNLYTDLADADGKRQIAEAEAEAKLTLIALEVQQKKESIMANALDTQPYEPAIQEALRPIHEKASCETKLIYLSSRLLDLQKRLSGALNDVLCSPLPMYTPAIHNYKLSINSLDLWAVTSIEVPEQSRMTTHTISKKLLLCSNCAQTSPNLALLQFCRKNVCSRVENPALTF